MSALPDVLLPPADLALTAEIVAATQVWLERVVIGQQARIEAKSVAAARTFCTYIGHVGCCRS